MKVNYVKLTAGVLTGFMALSSVPYAVYAAGPTAGVASYTSDIVSTSNTLTAGVTSHKISSHACGLPLHPISVPEVSLWHQHFSPACNLKSALVISPVT